MLFANAREVIFAGFGMRVSYCVIQRLHRSLRLPYLRRALLGSAEIRCQCSFIRSVHDLSQMSERACNNTLSKTYQEAVLALNNLQSNAAELKAKIALKNITRSENIPSMINHLKQLDIHSEDLDKLNVIHITGTKGKGSTAALTESILRRHGYKTGFYSSPHLVEVRERIRLDGAPISKELFTKYFWQVYDRLKSQLGEGEAMPPYFKFLTLVAFKVFIGEKVDTAILEAGIGGRFDSTNVVSNPVCTAITSLGIDHVDILGHTLEEISWQKAGIFKALCPAVTVSQNESAMNVLLKCSEEVGCPLYLAPPFDARQRVADMVPSLGLDGDVQHTNASLAVQLCKIFIDRQIDRQKWIKSTHGLCTLQLVDLNESFRQGLTACRWPGRYHQVRRDGVTYYLDGAHTTDSITHAFNWFIKQSATEREKLKSMGRQVKTVLVFNKTGTRPVKELLNPIASRRSEFSFDLAVFCPNLVTSAAKHSDCLDRRVLPSVQMTEVFNHRDAWLTLNHDQFTEHVAEPLVDQRSENGGRLHESDTESSVTVNAAVHTFPSLSSALNWLGREDVTRPDVYSGPESISNDIYLQVFIAGSLYLVGNSFYILKEEVM